MASASPPKPRTAFDWGMYADATFAGLSPLIPVPFVDSAFEWFFRRRIAAAVARRRGRRLDPRVLAELNRDDAGWLESCLLLPLRLAIYIIKKLSRKLLYFLSIKEATDQLSRYWHRAFLLDFALELGHLDDLRSAQVARQALLQTLKGSRTSPLAQLAQQVVGGARHIFITLRRARRGQEDEVVRERKSRMAQAWGSFENYLAEVARHYQQAYAAALAQREAAEAEAARQAEQLRAAEAEFLRKDEQAEVGDG